MYDIIITISATSLCHADSLASEEILAWKILKSSLFVVVRVCVQGKGLASPKAMWGLFTGEL